MKSFYATLLMLGTIIGLASCKKENASKSASASVSSSTISSTGAIAISLASGTTTDSVYMVGCYGKHDKIDTVAFSALPTAIGTYLTTNYSGYTFKKAYTIDSASTVVNYIVVIKYNSALVGLKFTAAGTFVSTLEQREGRDLKGPGWHLGGPFDNRDGKHRDTVAISALPTAVSSYFSTTYPTDTLLHASVTPDNVYVLISKNGVLYSTAITAAGKLVKRVQIEKHDLKHAAVTEANLPAAITTYLTTTYPGYVFDKAFSESSDGTLQGYVVFITSNSTKYAIIFNASGTFVKALPIH
ncbi:Putative beta-lactamase-inhibitor-like, PepSY-like [Mucilaginibacter gossypiicola]|uniref:Putative beta-lactamase-inhibitor-like, PepSY-like n=1 Tax=Mucilaginibacter gossypiicola TaxID=551995 RepID=A0A1H8HZE6_9SPHI|nr:PepSY-like domain-containing protein [Mucilaginibacter gossypiicola]SEN60978.1 Putative beta-lactamase-inhibitor-like, PepSY-like [Mucilaginibacter gossypiicola]